MKLKVEGMSCGGCVGSVKKILVRQLEVAEDSVDVSLDEGAANVPDDVDPARLDAALQKLDNAGFHTTRS